MKKVKGYITRKSMLYVTGVEYGNYPTPNIIRQDLTGILDAAAFTDRIFFGRTNYSRRVSAYDGHRQFYAEQADTVITYCREHSIDLHIKKGTALQNH